VIVRLLLVVCLPLALAANSFADPQHARPFPPAASRLTASLAPGDVDGIWGVDRGQVRSEQIQLLEQLVANTTDPEELADYYFRLGEIHTKIALANLGTNKGKDALLKGVKTWKALTDNDRFRNFPRIDVGLFQYGYLLQSGKYLKEARAVYDKLLKNYPASIYVPLAHLAFADYHFDSGQMADAEARYKMVLKFPKSAAYPYAYYKLGWIYFHLQRTQEALEAMYQVITATRTDEKQARLAAAARTDFVHFYGLIGKRDKALEAFKRVDAKHADEMLAQLAPNTDQADVAWRGGRYTEAGHAYAAVAADVDTPNDQAREAALNAIAAFANALNIDPDPRAQLGAIEMKARKLRVTPLSASEKELLEVFALYGSLVRDSRDARIGAMRIVEAGLLRAHGDHAHAVPVLVDYLHWNADPALAELAARTLLDSLVAQNRHGEALDVVKRWEAESFLDGKADLARDVDSLRSRSPKR
jgi:tetratricopeptide (TPR) repeat protein